MTRSFRAYGVVEAVLGRDLCWRLGRWLYTGARRELLNDPRVNGEYALQDWYLAAKPASGDVFLDVGVFLGDWTLTLAERLAAAGVQAFTIHAFEPSQPQFEYCRKRFDAAGSGHIVLHSRGLGAATGIAEFAQSGAGAGSSSLVSGNAPQNQVVVRIPVTTLDAFAAEQGYSRLDFVKVDTEGNDFNVVLGAKGLFDRAAIGLMQVEYNWRWIGFGHRLRDVFEFVGGRPYKVGRLTGEKIEFYREWHPELERLIETNFVIVHNELAGRLPHADLAFGPSNVPM